MNDVHGTEALVLKVIIQLVLIIAIARAGGMLSRRLGHPTVVGEIAAGLLLGPSFLGRFFPAASEALFPGATTGVIDILSQVGLILLMFLIGMEFDFAHVRSHGRAAAWVAVCGILVPFALGLAAGAWMRPFFPAVNGTGFCLFLAAALSITAIPVLGRVMVEFNIHRTGIGVLTITAAALDDALGWIVLAAVSAVVGARFDALAAVGMVVATLVFVAVMGLVVRPLLVRWIGRAVDPRTGELSLDSLAAVLVAVFACAAVTNWIGIFSLFGAFTLGAVLYDQERFREAVFRRLKDFVTAFFIPIFFTYTGLQTDIGGLGTGRMWLFLGVVLAAAFAGKLAGCAVAARASGLGLRQAACVGVMMNTRGLMGLVAASIGLRLGVVPREVFCMLVLMCIVSTVLLSPALRRLMAGTELEQAFRESEFARAAAARGAAA